MVSFQWASDRLRLHLSGVSPISVSTLAESKLTVEAVQAAIDAVAERTNYGLRANEIPEALLIMKEGSPVIPAVSQV